MTGNSASLSVRVTDEFDKALEKKALEYGTKKSTLGSLALFIGFFALETVEKQIRDVGERYTPAQVVQRMATGQDIGAHGWSWSVKNLLRPAIAKMSVEEFTINAIQNLDLKRSEKR